MDLTSITPVILTRDEVDNIERTLAPLEWASRIVVVDSGSRDGTLEVLASHPAVDCHYRAFDTHARQWSFAVAKARTPWVLVLDADHVLQSDARQELELLEPPDEVSGFRARFIYCIDGTPIRCGVYPPKPILYRRARGTFVDDGHTQRLILEGREGQLRCRVLHDDRKPLDRWLAAQARYSRLEAEKLASQADSARNLAGWLRSHTSLAPLLAWLHCAILRGGLLDGREGRHYAWQRFTAEVLIRLRLQELRLTEIDSTTGREAAAPENRPQTGVSA